MFYVKQFETSVLHRAAWFALKVLSNLIYFIHITNTKYVWRRDVWEYSNKKKHDLDHGINLIY